MKRFLRLIPIAYPIVGLFCLFGNANGVQEEKKTQPELTKLLIERRDTLQKLVDLHSRRVQFGTGDLPQLFKTQDSLLDAKLQLAKNDDEKIKLFKMRLELRQSIEKTCLSRSMIDDPVVVLEATAARLQAEIDLRREQQKMAKPLLK